MIKSKIKANALPKPKSYPYLGTSRLGSGEGEVIVLFTGQGIGICLHSDDPRQFVVGGSRVTWNEDLFLAMHGILELSNGDYYEKR